MTESQAHSAHEEIVAYSTVRKTIIRGIGTDEDGVVFDPNDFSEDKCGGIDNQHATNGEKISMV